MGEPGTPQRRYKKKTASDLSFYGGFFKGAIASFEGLLMFCVNKPLQTLVKQSLKPLRNATFAYIAFILFIVFLAREPLSSNRDIFVAFMRWSRLVTVLISLVLERALKANSKMFFAALGYRDARYASALESAPIPARTLPDRLRKVKRVAKMMSIRMFGGFVALVMPSSKVYVSPIMKYVATRSVLGDPGAAGLALLEVCGTTLLKDALWDDVLLGIGEALVDAEDLSMDGVREFYRRLEGEETRKYFRKRFRGYLAGSGFVNSLLMQVPLLGVPFTLVAECSAACVVVEIVTNNLHKDNRIAFPVEDQLQKGGEDESKKSS